MKRRTFILTSSLTALSLGTISTLQTFGKSNAYYKDIIKVNGQRIESRIMELAKFGRDENGRGYTKYMQSGAIHDSQNMSLIAPMAMIFVPSVGGISHSPKEFTKPGDMANGANVLLQTILAIDR
jgi:hypothetical protein